MSDGVAPTAVTIAAELQLSGLPVEIAFFDGVDAKLSRCDVHPVRPWVAAADRNAQVYLYDTDVRSLLHQTSVRALDDACTHRHTRSHLRHRSLDGAQVQPDNLYPGPPPKVGQILAVAFIDAQSLRARYSMKPPKAGAADAATDTGFSRAPNWLAVVAEHRTYLLHLTSFSVNVVTQPQLDNKTVTAFDFVASPKCPWLVFACADGVVRLWDYVRGEVVRRLSGPVRPTHRVTSFLRDGQCHILAAGLDGNICVWNAEREQIVLTVPRAHEGQPVATLSLDHFNLHFATSGGDRSVLLWDLLGTQEQSARLRLGARKPFTHLVHLRHPALPPPSFLAVDKSSKIMCISVTDKTTYEVMDLTAALGGPHRQFKIYDLATHPSRPNFIVCCTNHGIVAVDFVPHCNPAIVGRAEPSGAVTTCHIEGHTVYGSAFSPSAPKERSFPQKLKLGASRKPGTPVLSLSPSGKYLALVWNIPSQYTILNVFSKEKVDSGPGDQVVWALDTDTFAVLSCILKPSAKRSSGSHRANIQSATVSIKSFAPPPGSGNSGGSGSGSGEVINAAVPIAGNAIAIFGGPLLGVSFLATDGEPPERRLCFVSWSGWEQTPTDLAPPREILWNPARQMCALIYPDRVSFFVTEPSFKYLCRVLMRTQSAVWALGALVASTTTDIYCIFPNRNDRLVVPMASASSWTDVPTEWTALLPPVQKRPLGPLTLVGMVANVLIMLDGGSELHYLSFAFPGIKALLLASAGFAEESASWGLGVADEHHDTLACFLADHDFHQRAVKLPGLSLWVKAWIQLHADDYDAAIGTIDRLAASAAPAPAPADGAAPVEYPLEISALSVPDPLLHMHIVDRYLLAATRAKAAHNHAAAERAFRKAAALDPACNDPLIVFLIETDQQAKLTELKAGLVAAGHYQAAYLAAAAQGDNDTIIKCLARSGRFSEATLLASRQYPHLTDSLVGKWNEGLAGTGVTMRGS